MWRCLLTMKNIWGCQLLLGKQKSKASCTFMKEFGINSKGGKKNSYHKRGEKSWSRLFYKRCLLTLWGVLNYPRACARILNCFSGSFCEATKVKAGKSLGLDGINYVNQNVKEGWDSKILKISIYLFWVNKYSVYYITRIHSSIRFLRPNTFH